MNCITKICLISLSLKILSIFKYDKQTTQEVLFKTQPFKTEFPGLNVILGVFLQALEKMVFVSDAIEFVSIDLSGVISIHDEAIKLIESIQVPVIVIGMVGMYRTGKSCALNRLSFYIAGDDANKSRGFATGSTIQAKTKGLWIRVLDLPHDQSKKVILMDTEGLCDAKTGSQKRDVDTFTLSILLIDHLVYNGMNNINEDDLKKLHFVGNMTEHLKMKSSGKEDGRDFDLVFPTLTWTIRDCDLDLVLNGVPVTADEYLEHVLKSKSSNSSSEAKVSYNKTRENLRYFFKDRKCFVFPRPALKASVLKEFEKNFDHLDEDYKVKEKMFCRHLITNSKEKTIGMSQKVTGSMFIELTKTYVQTMNNGSIPCIQSAIDSVAEIENSKAYSHAVEFYKTNMEKALHEVTSSAILMEMHEKYSKEANQHFISRSFYKTMRKYQEQLEKDYLEIYATIFEKYVKMARKKTWTIIEDAYAPLEESVVNGKYNVVGGYKNMKEDMDNFEGKFQDIFKENAEALQVLTEFLLTKDSQKTIILKLDESLTKAEKDIEDEKIRKEMETKKAEAAEASALTAKQNLKCLEASVEEHKLQLIQKHEQQTKETREIFETKLQQRLDKQKECFEQEQFEQAKKHQEDIERLQNQKAEWEEENQNTGGFWSGLFKSAVSIALSLAASRFAPFLRFRF